MTNKSIQSRLAAIFITVMMSLMMQHPATAQSIHPNLTCYTELDGLPAPAVLSHYDPSEDTRLIYKPEEQPVGASGDFRFNVVKFDKVNKIHKFKKYRIYYFITYFKN